MCQSQWCSIPSRKSLVPGATDTECQTPDIDFELPANLVANIESSRPQPEDELTKVFLEEADFEEQRLSSAYFLSLS